MKFRHLLLLIALIVPILICSNALFAQPLVTGVASNRGSTSGGTLVIMGSEMIIAICFYRMLANLCVSRLQNLIYHV